MLEQVSRHLKGNTVLPQIRPMGRGNVATSWKLGWHPLVHGWISGVLWTGQAIPAGLSKNSNLRMLLGGTPAPYAWPTRMRRTSDAGKAQLGRPCDRLFDQEGLTRREREVAERVAQGYTNREIAADLFLSPKTVKKSISRGSS
ncbi:helix-turn-helix transcriptional regulator [Nocardia sp. NPDC047038]|uniref:response regulator transcription factor n=1 Tax=Nocardia sp. NPDC047038 TaxID=3154338 RepID=UPI0033DFC95F